MHFMQDKCLQKPGQNCKNLSLHTVTGQAQECGHFIDSCLLQIACEEHYQGLSQQFFAVPELGSMCPFCMLSSVTQC